MATTNKITTGMLLRIFLYEPDAQSDASGFSEKMAMDFVKIAYLCNLSTLPEILRLFKKNLNEENLLLKRFSKNRASADFVNVNLTPELRRLIDKYKQKGNTKYVFPILNLTTEEKKQLIKLKRKNELTYKLALHKMEAQKMENFITRVNNQLQKIADCLYPNTKLTSNLLRTALQHHRIRHAIEASLHPLKTTLSIFDKDSYLDGSTTGTSV